MNMEANGSPIGIGFNSHVCGRELTSWQSKGREVCEKVAWPLALVLSETLGGFLTDAGGQVGVVVGGKALASI